MDAGYTRKFKAPVLLLLITAMLSFSIANSQTDKENFNRAAALRKEAHQIRNKDSYLSERLYDSANRIYPGLLTEEAMFGKYAYDPLYRIRLEEGNIIGADKALENAIGLTEKMEDLIYFGDSRKAYHYDRDKLLVELLRRKIVLNLFYGDQLKANEDILKFITLNIDTVKRKAYQWATTMGWGDQLSIQDMVRLSQLNAFLSEDLDQVKKLQSFFQKMKDVESVTLGEMYILFLTGRKEEAIAYHQQDHKLGIKQWVYYIASVMSTQVGKDALAEKLGTEVKIPLLKGKLRMLIPLAKGKFNETLEVANKDLRNRVIKTNELVQKFYSHYLRGCAYRGLQDLKMARLDFEAALQYHPGFTPARDALAAMESTMVTQSLTDKTAPEISILEPSLQRGLKPASGMGEITVKGKANDQGEIKEVKINGEKVYVNAEGVFWGNVRLTAGTNRVNVEAVDGSGNASRLTFEVDHAPGTASATENYKPGRNFALLISCQNYDDSRIQSLQNPIADAIKLKIILRDQYNFSADNIFTIFNPGLRDFKKQIIELSELVQPEDNFLIFYAGHGVWLPDEKKGFWMLADAVANDVNTWLPNKEVIDWLSRLQSRHTLLITDACFSGSVFRTRGFDPNAPSQVQQLMNKVSRTAITSGNDTEVPDESVFMKYLIKALAENREKYLSAQKMFVNQIIEPVMNESKIEPRYGTLEMAGHIGGDFIFVRK